LEKKLVLKMQTQEAYKSKGEFLGGLEKCLQVYERKNVERNEEVLAEYGTLSSRYEKLRLEKSRIEEQKQDSSSEFLGLKGSIYLTGGGLVGLTAGVSLGMVMDELVKGSKDVSGLIAAPIILGAFVLITGGFWATYHGLIGALVGVAEYSGNKLQKKKLGKIESKMQKLEQELHSEKYSGLEGRLRK